MSSVQVKPSTASTQAAEVESAKDQKHTAADDTAQVTSTVTQFAGTAVREADPAPKAASAPAPAPEVRQAVAEAHADVAVAEARLELAEARLDRAELSEETVVARHDGAPAPAAVTQVTEKAAAAVVASTERLAAAESKSAAVPGSATGAAVATPAAAAAPATSKEAADVKVAEAELHLAQAVEQKALVKASTTTVTLPPVAAPVLRASSDLDRTPATTSGPKAASPAPAPAPAPAAAPAPAPARPAVYQIEQNLVAAMTPVDQYVADQKIDQPQSQQTVNAFVQQMSLVDQYVARTKQLAGFAVAAPQAPAPQPVAPTSSAPIAAGGVGVGAAAAGAATAASGGVVAAPAGAELTMKELSPEQARQMSLLSDMMEMMEQRQTGLRPQLPSGTSVTDMQSVIGRLEGAVGKLEQAQLGERAQQQAGTLGAYMHASGMKKVDVNQLYELSNNKGGKVPEDVQKAATFMLKHPEIYKQIETSDRAGADGISGVANFDKAAQGLTDFNKPEQARLVRRAPVDMSAANRQGGDQAEKAAGALGAYMHANGLGKVDVNQLYELSNNKGGEVPKDVQKAATFMLKHPEIYKKIETSDVAGADGISGVANFDKAAQGLTKFGQPEHAKHIKQVIADLPQTDRHLGDQAEKAAGALGAYMHANGLGAVDVNQLYDLSNNKGGEVPKDVQKAATFMLKHPEIYKKIETSDVAGADGISGVANFDKAAQGLTKFEKPHGVMAATDLHSGAATAELAATMAALQASVADQQR